MFPIKSTAIKPNQNCFDISLLFYISVKEVISIDDDGRIICQPWLQHNYAQNLELFGHCINGEFDQSEQNCVFQHD